MDTSPDPLQRLSKHLAARRRDDIEGRPVVILAPVLASATRHVEQARENGAARILVITWGDGTGPLPEPDRITVHRLAMSPVHDVVDEVRAWQHLLRESDDGVGAVLDAFDPEARAVVIVALALGADSFYGRRTYGARSETQERLEDKTLSRELWEAAGVPHAPDEVVPARLDEVRAAAARLDRGVGTVWSADASEGLNGGAVLVRHVTDDGAAAYEALAPHAERLRLMPYLEGVPCSIHGQVADDGVAVLRPVELVMLQPHGSDRFRQAGISSWWDPAPADRDQMRATARAVGEVLARRHHYRGSFGIDGILTAEGFIPHELNPRHSGGISTLGKGLERFSLLDTHQHLLIHGTLPLAMTQFEDLVVEACDAARIGSAYLATEAVQAAKTTTVHVCGHPGPDALVTDDVRGALQVVDDEAGATGQLEIGPASMGALVRFTPLAIEPGERLAPWALAAYELADRLWGTGYGDLVAQPQVR